MRYTKQELEIDYWRAIEGDRCDLALVLKKLLELRQFEEEQTRIGEEIGHKLCRDQ